MSSVVNKETAFANPVLSRQGIFMTSPHPTSPHPTSNDPHQSFPDGYN
jgi:hypothetical protein